jgi:hypothetical protein
MIFWIRKFGTILAATAFFALLFSGLAGSRNFASEALVPVFLRAIVGASLFWVAGIVVADIVLKGILTDIAIDTENLVEGGVLQQVQSVNERALPGGPDMPFLERKKPEKKTTTDKGK